MNVTLNEVFFRDGAYAIDFGFTANHLRVIGAAMESAGCTHVEIGHGYGLGAERAGYPKAAETDEAYLKTASDVFNHTAFGVYCIPGIGNEDDIRNAARHGIRFINIGNNITEIETARPLVETAKGLGLETTVCLMKAYVLDPQRFAEKVAMVGAWRPDGITIMDSAGNMTSEEVKNRVETIRERGNCRAGFHGHNNLSLAAANSLTAIESGATRIDVSLGGIGRSAGNAPTEAVTALAERKGIAVSPTLGALEPLIETVRTQGLPLPSAVTIGDILLGLYGLHSSIAETLDRTAQQRGLQRAELYRRVAEANPVNPSNEEITAIADKMGG